MMPAAAGPADLVLRGGPVFSSGRVSAVDVAVTHGRITAVAPRLDDLVDRGTEVVDLDGGLLLPGFQDAHVHPVHGGLLRSQCDLTGPATAGGYVEKVADYARAHPERGWVTGGGWAMSAFPGGTPEAVALDRAVPDRPVYLPNRDYHGAWVNSRALALAGVDRDTPDPPDGRIERTADGSPAGTLHEGAMELVSRLVPEPTHDDHVDALLTAQTYLHSLGITAWQDAIVGKYGGDRDVLDVYVDVAADGRLTARVVGALWWDRDRGCEQLADLRRRRARGDVGRFTASSVKIMQDGVLENFSAGLLEPYLNGAGRQTGNRGLSFVAPQALRDIVTALDAAGFQVHFHAIGDRAVREALDAFEAAHAVNGPTPGRHHIAHVQVVHPDDVPRFARLDVAANIQALWAVNEPQMTELTLPFLGDPRSSWQYPFADLRRAGVRLVAGSDWPVSSPDPLAAVHVAVNRRSYGGAEPPFLAEQRIGLADALTAYTAGSAYVNHLDQTGAIEVGRYADLVVLDRDPFAGPPEEIGATAVRRTYVEGQCVFAR